VVSFDISLFLDRFIQVKPSLELQFIRPFPNESSDFSVWGVVTHLIRNIHHPFKV
jgi:hypothetical protein